MATTGTSDAASSDAVQDALANGRFGEMATICDRLELENAAAGQATPGDWPYAIHILGHLYNNDLNNARFLWKRIPSAVKQSDSEVAAAWRIGQAMWRHDRPATYEALRSFSWSPRVQPVVTALTDVFSQRMFALLRQSYSSISVADAAAFLGQPMDTTITMTMERGWSHDPATAMLTVHNAPTKTEQKTNLNHLQVLTEYVFHLEH